jgi:hypothetical protein
LCFFRCHCFLPTSPRSLHSPHRLHFLTLKFRIVLFFRHSKPGKLKFCKRDDDDEAAIGEGGEDSRKENVVRAARLLGLTMTQLEGPASDDAWGFAGSTRFERIGCAVRATLREAGRDSIGLYSAAKNDVCDAAELLVSELRLLEGELPDLPFTSGDNNRVGRSPVTYLRSGALGAFPASAVVSATSNSSSEERNAGLTQLRALMREEIVREREASTAVFLAVGEDAGLGDRLLLTLALAQALLEDRRENEALSEARVTVKLHGDDPSYECPAAFLVLAQCLLRLGKRAEGLAALDGAVVGNWERSKQRGWSTWLRPLWLWGQSEASRLLVAHKAAENARLSAVDAYTRGSFHDAALLYGRCIDLLKVDDACLLSPGL